MGENEEPHTVISTIILDSTTDNQCKQWDFLLRRFFSLSSIYLGGGRLQFLLRAVR